MSKHITNRMGAGVVAALAALAMLFCTLPLPAFAAGTAYADTDARSAKNIEAGVRYLIELNELRLSNRTPLTAQQIADANSGLDSKFVDENTAPGTPVPALKYDADLMSWAQTRANALAAADQKLDSHDGIANGRPSWVSEKNLTTHPDYKYIDIGGGYMRGVTVFGPEALAYASGTIPGYSAVQSWASELETGEQGYGHYLTEVSPLANLGAVAVAQSKSGAVYTVLEIAYSKDRQGQDPESLLPQTAYTVTFDAKGGSAVAAQTVNDGETAARPADPTKSGHMFAGWYTDAALKHEYDFGAKVTKNITLYAKWTKIAIDSVETPADQTVESGVEPNYPSTLKAKWNNGDATDLKVTWTKLTKAQYANRKGGTYTVDGVAKDAASGAQQQVSFKVTVKAASAKEVKAQPAGVATTPGVAPKAPASVPVVWSNGDETDEPIVWDAGFDPTTAKYDTLGERTFTGTAQGLPVTWTVNVVEADAVSATATVESVDTIATHEPDLSGVAATVRYSDGSTSTNAVAWDVIEPAKYAQAGDFTVNGTVRKAAANAAETAAAATVDDALADAQGNPLTVSVKVHVDARVITEVEMPTSPIMTEATADATKEVPVSVTVVWNDGAREPRDVIATLAEGWNKGIDLHVATATGRTEGWDQELRFVVNVAAATPVSAANPAAVSVLAGKTPTLPSTVNVTYSNGETIARNVTWDQLNIGDFEQAGVTVPVNGKVEGLSVAIVVNVTAATLTGVDDAEDVTTEAGQTPSLPSTVAAHWSDGTTSQAAVTWTLDGVDFANRSGKDKTVTVKGAVDGWKDQVSVKVTVRSARATSATLDGAPVAITVDSGTDPAKQFPKQAHVAWSDGGENTVEDIAWDAFGKDLWNAREGGEHTVNGVTKTTDRPVSLTVTVNAATVKTVDGEDEALRTVKTEEGVTPELPKTVAVAWSNGDVTDEPVVWNDIAAGDLAKAGTFTLEGVVTVDGQAHTVSVNVEVTAKADTDKGDGETGKGELFPDGTLETGKHQHKTDGKLSATGASVAIVAVVVLVLAAAAGALFVVKRRK